MECLAQFRLLMDGEVGRPRRREPPDELVVVLERSARRRLQLYRLVDLAICDPPRDRQRLDRVECRPCWVHLSGALIEGHDEVMQLVLRRREFLPWKVADFEREEPMRGDRTEHTGDPVLFGLIQPQLDADLSSRMPVDREVCSAQLPLLGQVGEHAQVGSSIGRIDEPEPVATLRVRLQR